jgi:sporulation protein YlmC with PRC-barrel domain
MFAKFITAGLVGTALLATAAFAQTPTATTDRAAAPSANTAAASHEGQWRSSKVVGLNVYNDSNENLGSINELLLDKNGKIEAVIIGVGGFLGVGEHYVSIPFEKIKWVNEPVQSAVSTSAANRPSPTGTSSTTTTTTTTGSAGSTSSSSSSQKWYPDHAVLSTTKDELKALPEFKYST